MSKTKPPAIPVHIVMVLDESGSMSSLRDDLIGGVNSFLAEQRATPGKCRLTMVKFAPYTVLHDAVDIAKVPDLTPADYTPHSMTPLLDAEGTTISRMLTREQARAAAEKPAESVLFVTFTDGAENTSHEYTFAALSAMKKDREAAGWTFLYLGVGHDAYGQSTMTGTHATNTVSHTRSKGGMRRSFAGTSAVASNYRAAANAGDTVTLTAASLDAYNALGVDKNEDDDADAGSMTVTTSSL